MRRAVSLVPITKVEKPSWLTVQLELGGMQEWQFPKGNATCFYRNEGKGILPGQTPSLSVGIQCSELMCEDIGIQQSCWATTVYMS